MLTVADFFFVDELAPYDARELIPKKGDAALALRVLEKAAKPWQPPNSRTMAWKPRCAARPKALGIKAGQMFEPVRVAVCGRKTAPPLFGTLEVLGPRDLPRRGSARPLQKLKSI